MPGEFVPAEREWSARMETLRQIVRTEMVARQLAAHLPDPAADGSPARVLDIGCGQGTQALRLARRGFRVTGLDSSAELLGEFEAALRREPGDVRARVTLVTGDAEQVAEIFEPHAFDLVLCHGVLMYLPDPEALLASVAQVLALGGCFSLLVRNGDALALRPALAGDWATAAQAFDGAGYRNNLGLDARADRREELTAALARHGLIVTSWYGVRILTDHRGVNEPAPSDPDELALLLQCEERAGRTDPYRAIAALTHLIAREHGGRGRGRRALQPASGAGRFGGEVTSFT